MGKVLGLTKNNDQYEDVPDDLKWAVPLHEHFNSPEMQRWFAERKAQSQQRVRNEVALTKATCQIKSLKLIR